jgi:hypothetical protein
MSARRSLLAGICALALSACGGTTKPAPAARPDATAAFEFRVGTICLNGEDRIFATAKSDGPSLAQLADIVVFLGARARTLS